MSRTTMYIFVLLLALILVVYYIGASSDILAGAKAGQILGFTLTGRNAAGKFQGYPNGNPTVFQPAF